MTGEAVERKLFEILLARDFFPAAQRSLQRHLDWSTITPPAEAYHRGKLRGVFRTHVELLEDKFPFDKLRGILLPDLIFHAERWQQMTTPSILAARPYLRYVSALLPDTRHAERHGLILPSDHAFWATWFPPNGYPCRCTVTSVSNDLLTRRCWTISTNIDMEPPDEGFDFNPGLLAAELMKRV